MTRRQESEIAPVDAWPRSHPAPVSIPPGFTSRLIGLENRLLAEASATASRLAKLEARVDRMAGVLRAIVAERDAGAEPTDSENE